MVEDARFEDAQDRPLHLKAMDAEDLAVISALVQDAVVPATEIRWNPRRREFALLINRFRWEDADAAERARRDFERVQSVLLVTDVLRAQTQGYDPRDRDAVLSLLRLTFEPEADGAGHLLMTLAGDGTIRLHVETLDVTLRDVTRPYVAPSGRAPRHD